MKNRNATNSFNLERIFTLKGLSFVLGIPEAVLINYSTNAPKHYRPFIKKMGEKRRRIANPDEPLKAIQRKINNIILNKVLLPNEMYGSVRGRNIKNNVEPHIGKRVVVTIDIRDCFPSVSYTRIFKLFREKFQYSKEVSTILTNLTTFRGTIPQGSPTSSMLLNILLIPLCNDIKLILSINNNDLSFWVDDISFSGESVHQQIQSVIHKLQRNGFAVRKEKIKIMFSGYPQQITGLGANRKISVPKKKISKYISDMKNPKLFRKSLGRLKFIENINPVQHRRLRKTLENRVRRYNNSII